MVEVWLPYSDTEISIMLPDPIDLRIQPGKFSPESREAGVLDGLYRVLSELDDVRILRSFFHTDVEVGFISRLLDRLEIDHNLVSSDYNVIVDIPRYDPILGRRCSATLHYLEYYRDDVLERVFKGDVLEYPSDYGGVLSSDILYIDLLVEAGGRLYDLFHSNGGVHLGGLWDRYLDLWSLNSELSSFIIASVGGGPWDSELALVASAFIKIYDLVDSDGVAIVVGDGVVKDSHIDKLVELDVDAGYKDLESMYLGYLVRQYGGGKRIYYYGSLPSTFLRRLNLKSIRSIDRMIRTLPSRLKRSISVVEDLLHLYPGELGGG
jgi:hypothetical protein